MEYSASFIDFQDSIFAYKDSVYFDPAKKVASPQRYSASQRVDLPADKYDKLYYTVQSGDNVGYIADWYDVRASDLRYWNNISRDIIRGGQKLVIYKPKGKSAHYEELNNMSFAQKQQFAGRPLSSGVSPPPASVKISSGSVSGSGSASASGGSPPGAYITYTVKSGDTLWEIAKKYPGVSETDIARINNMGSSSKIRPGQVLRIKPKG
jgi:membrane-bound lytic murein transglycosylase D